MFEKYNDAEQLSCKNVLDGRYVSKVDGWKDIDDDTRYELFKLFREYVANTARGRRRQRIMNASICLILLVNKRWKKKSAIARKGIFRLPGTDFSPKTDSKLNLTV